MVVLDPFQQSQPFQLFGDRRPGGEPFHPRVLRPGCVGNAPVEPDDVHDGQALALADLKVHHVMPRRDLERAGAELHLDGRIANHRNFAAYDGQHCHLANLILIAFVVRVHRHAGIAQH